MTYDVTEFGLLEYIIENHCVFYVFLNLNLFEFITICIVQNVQMYLNVLNSNKT